VEESLISQLAGGSDLRLARSFDWLLVGYAGPGAPLREVTPLTYFVTELSVLWKYLSLLVIPWGQAIDHGYPVVASLVTAKNIAAGVGLLALIALAAQVRRLPLLSLGVAVFLLGLSVESTFIPLDPMVEHRLYLPMLGFVLAFLEGLRRVPRAWQALALGAVLIATSLLTWRRNELWTSPVALYQDAVGVHPENPRLWALLGDALNEAGEPRRAVTALEKAVELHPLYPAAWVDLGTLYANDGRWAEAEQMYRKALSLEPRFPTAQRNLGRLLVQEQKKADALTAFSTASALDPNDVESLFFEALLAHELGDDERAVRAAERLRVLDPARARHIDALVKGRSR